MTTATRERKSTKTVQIIARIQFKSDARKVVYQVRGSQGQQYETCLFAGKATSCTCPAHKPCYHMTGCEQKEAERVDVVALAREIVSWEASEVSFDDLSYAAQSFASHIADGEYEEYEAWKAKLNLDSSMSRDEYVQAFDPCGLEVC